MSGNSRFLAHRSEGSQSPRTQMPSKLSSNLARLSVRIIKHKQACRPRIMRPSLPPPWAELPFEITANILQRLGTVKILETGQYVCNSWRSVCNDPSMWRVIDIPETSRTYTQHRRMCRHAVDLSQGQLVDLNLEYFPSDKLLDYIAERSEKLRRLRLVHCHHLSVYGLQKAIERFSNLEEFHINLPPKSHIHDVVAIVKTIGESCPLLRSFAWNKESDYFREFHKIKSDETAYAIARSMPELRHLQLRGNGLTDEGLEAILDGCPHLESLDLDRCYHVKLIKGNLRKRCSSQIKCLRWKEYHLQRIPRNVI